MFSTRSKLVLIALAAVAFAAMSIAVIGGRADDGSDDAAIIEETQPTGGLEFKGSTRPLKPPRDFTLTNQDGEIVSTRDLRGRIVVVSPMYTTCTDTCPLVAQQIKDAIIDMPKGERDDVSAFAISVDPPGDTREAAKRFLQTRDVQDQLDFLIGSRSELRQVWSDYGFSEQLDQREHNSHVVVLDRKGRQRVGYPVDYLAPEALTHDLRLLVND